MPRHDANDYDENDPDSWPVCDRCGANSCPCDEDDDDGDDAEEHWS